MSYDFGQTGSTSPAIGFRIDSADRMATGGTISSQYRYDGRLIGSSANPNRANPSEEIREQFQRLANRWRDETGLFSSPSEKFSHPAYEEIIRMGQPVLRCIFEDLQIHGGHWHPALRRITGASPVTPEMAGQPRRIREAWLAWGRDHHYIR